MSGTISKPGVRAPGQGQIDSHLQASQMAHAAAQRAAVARVLARGNGSKSTNSMGAAAQPQQPHPSSYKNHVLHLAGMPGAGAQPVHQAIDHAVQAGHYTPEQGDDLKAHDGPLVGPPGANTIATLGSILKQTKGPT